MKFVVVVTVPPAVVILIGPVVAAAGMAATIWVAVLDVLVPLTPLKLTSVALVRFVPVIVTAVPTGPPLGEKAAAAGRGSFDGGRAS